MKKFFIFLLSTIIIVGCDTGVTVSNAVIKAEDFIKEDLLFPEDAEFSNGEGEQDGENSFHVVYNVRAKNILGATIPMKASVRLSYKGEGDWTDEANWKCSSISYLNLFTGETETEITKHYAELQKKLGAEAGADITKGDSPKSKTSAEANNDKIKLGGFTFDIIEKGRTGVRVYSKKKIQKLSDINKIYKDMHKKGLDQVQFCDKPNAARGEEYAVIQDNLYLDHERDIIKTLK